MKQVQSGLEEILYRGLNDGAYPGATYAVVKGNHIYLGALGNKENLPNPVPNSLDTIYDMASLTKVVCTTTCAMMLVERGYFRIYDPVYQLLPDFPHQGISVWHLMTHTSGLPEGITGDRGHMNEKDVLDKINQTELIFNPGEHISYSDINYILLGKIIEKFAEKPLNVFAKENLFDPLEMVDSGYLPTDKERVAATEYRDDSILKGIQKGFVHDETAYAMGGVAGHAGLFSTATDMTHFIQMILNKGVYNGKRILSENTVNALFKVQVKEFKGVEQYPLARCLGWQTRDPYSSAGELVSEETIIHTGFTGTNVFIDRINNIGFVLLSNRVHPTRKNLKHMHYRACAANYIMSHLNEW